MNMKLKLMGCENFNFSFEFFFVILWEMDYIFIFDKF